MKKPLVLIESPFTTRSGYGRRSYDFIKALIELYPDWDIKLVPIAWGITPQNALDINNSEHKILLDRIFKEKQLKVQPDIHIQITVANECRPLGKFNILVTAGIETNAVAPAWLEGANKMDLILTSSTHSKMGFINTTYNKMDNRTKQQIGLLKFEKLIDTIFEGYDVNKFYKTNETNVNIEHTFKEIKEDFNFLFVGAWLKGGIGNDRKDVGMLVDTFLRTFKHKDKNNKTPGLILKTHGATPSRIDRDMIVNTINNIKHKIKHELGNKIILPNVYVIHGELTTEELNKLYNHKKVKAFVSFTKGEGFGRTSLEFSVTNKPIIISNWSGHLDYLNSQGSVLLPGKLTKVHPSVVWKDIIEPNSMWFTVDYEIASKKLIDVFNNYNSYLNKTRRQKTTRYTYDKMKERIKMLFDKYIPTELLSEEITLNL